MSFDLGNVIAAPSQVLLDSAKKTDLLDIADHYRLPNIKKKTCYNKKLRIFSFSSLWTRKPLIPQPHLRF